MKKFIICLLAIAMIVLCFTGCRDDKNGTNSENVSETDAESSAETVEGETPADGEEEKVAKRLVDEVRANAHKAHFGILGAKWATRVLADYGYADDAYLMFVQPEMPGWAHWLQFGDGTLRESWASNSSHNHIMFGDLSAWAYEYAAGIVPLEPGFRKIAFRPHVLKGVDSFIATHKTPFGEIRAGWRRVGGKVEFVCETPKDIEVSGEKAQSLATSR